MTTATPIAPVRVLAEDVANKIAAGEVVERPASVVKELLENALDAGATRITVRVVAAGRRLIEVTDNGHGMSEQNALLSIERHATSKIRSAEDLEDIRTMGFRGEALASIASVSRFEMVTRREQDDNGTRIRIDGGILREVEQTGARPGTRVSVNRLYFNTPVRAKFLKGLTTELGHCIDVVQRHALARTGVGFQFLHNDKILLDIPPHATLRERVALIWGLAMSKDMIEVHGEQAGYHLQGIIGLPGLTRSARSHQFFFMNNRPVINRSLQYGFEDGYRGLVTIGRHPIGVLMLETNPRFVDVNIHPAKREIRFRDERVARDAVRDIVRNCLAEAHAPAQRIHAIPEPSQPRFEVLHLAEVEAETHMPGDNVAAAPVEHDSAPVAPVRTYEPAPMNRQEPEVRRFVPPSLPATRVDLSAPEEVEVEAPVAPRRAEFALASPPTPGPAARQGEFPEMAPPATENVVPEAVYRPVEGIGDAPMQLFDTYLLVPGDERLLIIDQHALHERLNFDSLMAELADHSYESQQLLVPIVIEVAPAQVRLLESNLPIFRKIGIELEPFGGNTFQVTAICHLYEEAKVRDLVYHVLDEIGQGDLFDSANAMADALRMATRACKASVRAGDPLTPQERRGLLEGFQRLRPPYTCPHGRPIIVELTQNQMEKSFRRIQ
jgi:DNA mismatch repair protein MutL